MKKLHLALILSSVLAVSGCSEKSSEEYIALAESDMQNDDMSSAIIELKNAISVNARDPRSRFMLGTLYAKRGSSAAAEKELLKALELGYEPNEVVPVLASVYSLQYKNEEIIELVDESRNLAPEVTTSLLLYKALAHFQLGEPYKAKKAVSDANDISSDSLYSRLGNAYVDFSNKQIDTSLAKINEILQEQPDFADAHLLKGQLTSVADDTEGAVESFETYKELLPETFQARVFLANAYIKNAQFDKAEKEIDLLLKVNPEQPFVNQLKGTVRFQDKDFANAKTFTEKAIRNGISNISNRVVAGISAFRLGSYEQAYDHLSSIKDRLPAKHPLLKMLAILELKLGSAGDSISTLSNLEGLSEDDIILLSAASAQLMREGKTGQYEGILKQVDSIEFTDPLRMAQKGMLRLSLDDVEGLTDLEQALALDPDQEFANTALARAYIDNGLFKEALELSETWIAQKPQEIAGHILAAVAYSKLGMEVQAEEKYNQALLIDPNNVAANTYYASNAELEGNTDSAVTYLEKIISANGSHGPTLKKYFILLRKLGNPEEAIKPIENAFNQDPENLQLRLLLAQALLTDKKYTQSISILTEVTPGEATPSMYWVVLGNAYFSSQQLNKVVNNAQEWVAAQPNNKNAYIRLIAVQEIFGNDDKALDVAESAQQKFPEDEQFTILVTYFNLVTGDLKVAERSFASLSDESKTSIAGKGLLGQLLLEKGDAKSALPKLTTLYEQRVNQRNATLVAKALRELRRYSEAISFLRDFEAQTGKSTSVDIQIAELAILSKDYDLAMKQYKQVLSNEPDNTRALNNLAYILIEQGDVGQAVKYAKQAAELSPEYPPVLDTYATTLFKTGQFDEAVKVYKRVYNYDRDNVQVALRYAEAMIAAQQTTEAGRVLASLESGDAVVQAEIQRLKLKI